MAKKKRFSHSKKFILLGSVFVFAVVLTFAYSHDSPVPHRNPADLRFSLYSDKHITGRAMETNPEFKTISFEPSVQKKEPFWNQVAVAINSIKSFIFISEDENKEYGTWVWTPVMAMTPEYIEDILDGAQKRGINAVYLSIDSYLDIFTMPKGEERNRKKEKFTRTVENFIKIANGKGISVDAEAGWRNWAEAGNEYKAFAVANFAKNFNASHEVKFRSFQYDVEPYLLDKYKEEPGFVLKNFLSLVDKTESFLSASGLKLSVVIPDFYDGKDKMTPKFSWGNKKDYVLGHLLRILDRRSGSSIIIMSYRNFAYGEDGSIEVSKNEMQTAKSKSNGTKIIIAQETGDFPPPYITFHSMSTRHFFNQVSNINEEFKNHPNFGGIAVHYINAFLALR